VKYKLLTFSVVFLLLLPEVIAIPNSPENPRGNSACQWYNVYKKTVFFFGGKGIHDEFQTPSDCQKLKVEISVGPYFTGEAGILIKSEGHRENHTLWGAGWYFFGQFVYPELRVFYEDWFDPGKQIVEIGGWGMGGITFWVNGTSE